MSYRQKYIEWDISASQVLYGEAVGYAVAFSDDPYTTLYEINTYDEVTAELAGVFFYSLDDGETWVDYPRGNDGCVFNQSYRMRVAINPSFASYVFGSKNGVIYRIRPDCRQIIDSTEIIADHFVGISIDHRNDDLYAYGINKTLYKMSTTPSVQPGDNSINLQANPIILVVDGYRDSFWQINNSQIMLKDLSGRLIWYINTPFEMDVDYSSSSSSSSESSSSSSQSSSSSLSSVSTSSSSTSSSSSMSSAGYSSSSLSSVSSLSSNSSSSSFGFSSLSSDSSISSSSSSSSSLYNCGSPIVSVVPDMTDYNAPSPYVITSTFEDGYGVPEPNTPKSWKAFNDDTYEDIGLYTYDTGGAIGFTYLAVDLGSGNDKVVNSYSVQARNYSGGYEFAMPLQWYLQSSNVASPDQTTDADWTILHTVSLGTVDVWRAHDTICIYDIGNSTSYRHYRIRTVYSTGLSSETPGPSAHVWYTDVKLGEA